jgi:ABC-type dipeptide/oligopeptide/nickel transport system ATPase component
MTNNVLTVQNLQISSGDTRLVHGVSFAVRPGEIVGLVGESGSGKTLSTLAAARLLPRGLSSTVDRLEFDNQDIATADGRRIRKLLGTRMAMVFQDPMSSLNPAMRIGAQMVEASRVHLGYSRQQARDAARRGLQDVHITDAERRLRQYPHELSGGMRQRVMIAMGLMSRPTLLIADEPTTALDVTVQAQVMTLLRELNNDHGTAILLVSHNIALLSEICDRVLVMYRGDLVDDAPVDQLTAPERHPYTRALIGAVPDLTTDRSRELVDVPEFTARSGRTLHA